MSVDDVDGLGVGELRARLREAEETLHAIRAGEVDALVVNAPDGDRVYTLRGADYPYRVLVEAMDQGAAALDDAGIVLYCNRRFADLFGFDQRAVVGKPIVTLVPDEATALTSLVQSAGRRRGRLPAVDGTSREVVFAVVPLPEGESATRGLIVTDLTDMVEARARREVAERENRAKDEFLAMLGHELRNPLGAIASATALLDMVGKQDPQTARAREVIRRQVKQLASLVDDLLDVGRVVTGKIKLRTQPVDLTAVLRATVSSLTSAHQAGPHVDVNAEQVWIEADPVRVEQIVGNLVGNALKYTEPSGKVGITLRKEGGFAQLTVTDTGVGIDADLLPRVFDLFVQGETALDRRKGGLGIGLTLTRQLVELHGGTVSAHSEGTGKGASFVVRFPAAAEPVLDADDGDYPLATDARRILVVEDDDDARETLVEILRLQGHNVISSADGRTALEAVRRAPPDVAILDLGLPELDGYALAQRIRVEQNSSSILLIAVSGYGAPSDRARAVDAGFDHHLTKPVTPEALIRAMTCGSGKASDGERTSK